MNKDWQKKSLRHLYLQLSTPQLSLSSMISLSSMMPTVVVPIIGVACTATL